MRFEVATAMDLECVMLSDNGKSRLGARIYLGPAHPGLLDFDSIDVVIRVSKGLRDANIFSVKPRRAIQRNDRLDVIYNVCIPALRDQTSHFLWALGVEESHRIFPSDTVKRYGRFPRVSPEFAGVRAIISSDKPGAGMGEFGRVDGWGMRNGGGFKDAEANVWSHGGFAFGI